MSNGIDTIAELMKKHHAVNPGDYIKNGLVHCGKCFTEKQCEIQTIDMEKPRIVFCLCKCDTKKRDDMFLKKAIKESAEADEYRRKHRRGD